MEGLVAKGLSKQEAEGKLRAKMLDPDVDKGTDRESGLATVEVFGNRKKERYRGYIIIWVR